MFRKIGSNEIYQLNYDASQKKVSLIRKEDNTECLKANFFYDTADGASLLSNFQYQDTTQKGLAKLTADMISDYLSTQKTCKLFCFARDDQDEFANGNEYKSSQLDRLMMREKCIFPKKPTDVPDITIEELNSQSATASDISQILTLLKQTYWAEDADENYVKNALENSVFLVARDQKSQIIGLVRYINDSDFAYISDMVVDKDLRKKGIATVLMQKTCELIDQQQYVFTALISAKEGDGKDAASILYGKKFGFSDYNQFHSNTIYFRYIKMVPALKETSTPLKDSPTVQLTFLPKKSEEVPQQAPENKIMFGKTQ